MAEFKFYMFFVWVAAMALACWSVEVARMFARRMKKEHEPRPDSPPLSEPSAPAPSQPPVAVILPIKGLDADTRENLAALLQQRYPHYRVLFTVESPTDPVLPLLEEIARNAPASGPKMETIIAGISATRGQKIHNQHSASHCTTPADEILVFLDADARVPANWLAALVEPLAASDSSAPGATTGFRFYVPENPGQKLPDTFVSIINAAVAALLGPGWRNIAWGGSMAIRRADFFSFGVHDAWQNALSDDYVLSWCVQKKAQRRIQFVPACLVPSAADFSWPGFWEFAARQYKITRICAPGVWLAAVTAATLYLLALAYTFIFWLLSVIGVVPAQSLTGRVDHLLLIMFLALYIANILRGWLLFQGASAAFPDQAKKLRPLLFWYTLGYPATLFVNLLALLKSAFGRTIHWRSVRYLMHNPLKTTVHRTDLPAQTPTEFPPLAPAESRTSP